MNLFEQLEGVQAWIRWRSLVHESGHVLVTWLVDGLPSSQVVAYSDSGHAVTTGSCEAALAGIVALEIIGDPRPRDGGARDLVSAMRFSKTEQDAAWERTRELLGTHEPALRHFARALEANAGRLAGREVTTTLRAALSENERHAAARRPPIAQQSVYNPDGIYESLAANPRTRWKVPRTIVERMVDR